MAEKWKATGLIAKLYTFSNAVPHLPSICHTMLISCQRTRNPIRIHIERLTWNLYFSPLGLSLHHSQRYPPHPSTPPPPPQSHLIPDRCLYAAWWECICACACVERAAALKVIAATRFPFTIFTLLTPTIYPCPLPSTCYTPNLSIVRCSRFLSVPTAQIILPFCVCLCVYCTSCSQSLTLPTIIIIYPSDSAGSDANEFVNHLVPISSSSSSRQEQQQ